jgi:hypothetical protein
MAIWEVFKKSAESHQKPQVNLAYLACHDVLTAVGCTAKCSNVTKVDSVRHLCTFLARHQQEFNVGSVTDFVVEGQVRASPKNLSLTAALFAWFTLCHTTSGRTPHMTTICAKNKFKGPLDLSDTDLPKAIDKTKGKGKSTSKTKATAGNPKSAASKTKSTAGNPKSAASKTKATAGNPKSAASKTKATAYRQRKKDAVSSFEDALACQLFTYTSTDVLSQWRTAKKKDDMADAALQGLWYIENKLKIKVE